MHTYKSAACKFSSRDSCQRGWRLFSIVAAYFECSEALKPYLFKYLETAAYDKRRAYHGKISNTYVYLKKYFILNFSNKNVALRIVCNLRPPLLRN